MGMVYHDVIADWFPMFLDFGAPALLQLVPPSISSIPSRLSQRGPSHEEVRDEEHEGNEEDHRDENSSDEEEGSEQDCSRKVGKGRGLQGQQREDCNRFQTDRLVEEQA